MAEACVQLSRGPDGLVCIDGRRHSKLENAPEAHD
jgi:hypothetical protein